jgi:hypothetical protein
MFGLWCGLDAVVGEGKPLIARKTGCRLTTDSAYSKFESALARVNIRPWAVTTWKPFCIVFHFTAVWTDIIESTKGTVLRASTTYGMCSDRCDVKER